MSDQDAFERILTSLHDTTLDDALWPTTSALIDDACGTVGNALLVSEGPPDDIRTHFFGLYSRGQRYADLEREWLEVYHPINESVPRFRELPDSQMVFTPDLYTAEELKTSPAYNEGLRRIDGQRGLMVRLAGPDGCTIGWASGDPVGGGSWASPQLALLQGLLPHIRQFVRVRQALVNASAQGASLSGLLDSQRIGVIHLDRSGRLVAANDRAAALLRQGNGGADWWEGLSLGFPADRLRLARLVAGALPTSSAPAVSGSMRLRRLSLPSALVVHVTPVDIPQPDFGARSIAALILLVEPGWFSGTESAVVAELLGLTPGESSVAVGLTAGRTVAEIAQATGRTVGAIHWHLRQIYRKHHIHRQADLVRLVLSVTAFARRDNRRP